MNILVIGDRRWNDLPTIKQALQPFSNNKDVTVYHKLETGAALIGRVAAEQLNIKVATVKDMYDFDDEDAVKIDLILCFHNYIYGSRKSADMITKAQDLDIEYQIIRNRDKE